MTSPSAPLRAWPYWLTLTFVPLVVLAALQGGWTFLLIPFYGWVLMPLLDTLAGKDLRNPDPDTPDSELFWFRLLTWICDPGGGLRPVGDPGHHVRHRRHHRRGWHRLFA